MEGSHDGFSILDCGGGGGALEHYQFLPQQILFLHISIIPQGHYAHRGHHFGNLF